MMSNESLPDIEQLRKWSDLRATDAEHKFRELLPRAEAQGDPGYLVEVLADIARSEYRQDRIEEAHRTLDRVQQFEVSRSGRGRLRLLLERGWTFSASGNPQLARELFLQAWEYAREIGEDGLAVNAAHGMGAQCQDDSEELVRWMLSALGIGDSSSDPAAKKWYSLTRENLGWVYVGMEQFESALERFEIVRDDAILVGDLATQLRMRWPIAHTLRLLGRFTDAMEILQELFAEAEAKGDTPWYLLEEIGDCLIGLGRTDKAKPLFTKAFEIHSKDEWAEVEDLERLKRLSQNG